MSRVCLLSVLSLALSATPVWAEESIAQMLEKGIYLEETAGNLQGAAEIYGQIVARDKTEAPLAAQAYYRLGMCQLKQNKPDKAAATFRQVLERFPTETQWVRKSRAELTRLDRNGSPRVVRTNPAAFKNDVSSDLNQITATFNQPMTDKSWSWTGGGETFPEVVGEISYNATRTVCTLPIKLEPGKAYWIGINSPSHRNFKNARGIPAARYVILFATAGANGKPTKIPAEMLAEAKRINAASDKAASRAAATSKPASPADKRKAEALAARGWKLWQQGNLEGAEKEFKAAVEVDGGNPHAWNGLGWSQFNQGKPETAREAFEKAVALEPKHAAALNGLGWIAKARGDAQEAIEHWTQAIEAAPTATAALNGLAMTHMEMEQYDEAVRYYEMWLKVEPDNADAKAGLTKAKAQSGRKDDAR